MIPLQSGFNALNETISGWIKCAPRWIKNKEPIVFPMIFTATKAVSSQPPPYSQQLVPSI